VANHKSAKKRAKQTIVKTERNKIRKTTVRSVIKALRTAIESNDKKTAQELLPQAQSYLYRLAKHGAINQNNAGRRTARLAAQVNKLA
jgi:small subunit ribosomal protein S20